MPEPPASPTPIASTSAVTIAPRGVRAPTRQPAYPPAYRRTRYGAPGYGGSPRTASRVRAAAYPRSRTAPAYGAARVRRSRRYGAPPLRPQPAYGAARYRQPPAHATPPRPPRRRAAGDRLPRRRRARGAARATDLGRSRRRARRRRPRVAVGLTVRALRGARARRRRRAAAHAGRRRGARAGPSRSCRTPSTTVAEPTPFDRIARAIGDFFERRCSNPELSGGWGSTFALIAAIVVVGRHRRGLPGLGRAARRPAARAPRDAAALRRDRGPLRRRAARRAAASHADAASGTPRSCCASARSPAAAVERGVVDTPPGATVHAFARAAARAFPALAAGLEDGRGGVRRRPLPAASRHRRSSTAWSPRSTTRSSPARPAAREEVPA